MASAQPHAISWRAACLRGISAERTGPHAVVALSAEQYLLLPLSEGDLTDWPAQLGRRVWVDMGASPMRLQADNAKETHHA